jgi:hypothetical protein
MHRPRREPRQGRGRRWKICDSGPLGLRSLHVTECDVSLTLLTNDQGRLWICLGDDES